jgi:hypothetical protein
LTCAHCVTFHATWILSTTTIICPLDPILSVGSDTVHLAEGRDMAADALTDWDVQGTDDGGDKAQVLASGRVSSVCIWNRR